MADPHWTAYLTALATPTLAFFGSLIAFRQWRTAQSKLKLDLFTRREAVYEAAKDMISSIITSGRTSPAQEQAYLAGTRAALWLFDKDIVDYLDKVLWHKVVDLGLYQSQLSGPLSAANRARIIHAQANTKKWVAAQHQVVDAMFARYLTLRH